MYNKYDYNYLVKNRFIYYILIDSSVFNTNYFAQKCIQFYQLDYLEQKPYQATLQIEQVIRIKTFKLDEENRPNLITYLVYFTV